MANIFKSNSDYLQNSFPQLFSFIQSATTYQERLAISSDLASSKSNHDNDYTSLSNLVRTTLRAQFINGVQRILLPRVQSSDQSNNNDEAINILQKSIDGTKSYLLDALPNLSEENYKSDSQKAYFAKDLILMGALGLSEIDSLINSCCINNLLVIDDGYESVIQLMEIADIEDIIDKCRKNNISLHFVIENDLDSLLNLLKKTLACEMFSSCFGFYLVISPPASALLESVSQWLKSQEGFAEFLMGLLGQETDEINQSIHSIYNYRFYENREVLQRNEINSGDIVIVASGPSLDKNIEDLKHVQKSLTIISAGSAIGALLRNGIKPDYAVLLEMSSDVFRDMCQLIGEGHDLTQIILIASATIDPRIASLFGSFVTYQRPVSTASLFFDNEKESALPYAGPQALNAAFEVSIYFNPNSITLLGADLSSPNARDVRSKEAVGLSPRDFDIPMFGTNNRTVFTDSGLLLTREALEAAMSFVCCRVNRVGEGLPIKHKCVVQYADLSSLFQEESIDISRELKTDVSILKTTQASIDPEKVREISQLVDNSLVAFAAFKAENLKLLLSEKSWSLSVSQYFSRSLSMADLEIDPAFKIFRRMLRLPLFYALQPLHDCSVSDPDSEKLIQSYSKSLDKIENFLSAYCRLVNRLLAMKVLPPYDPNFVKNIILLP